jgi:peptidyl-prolyl cis-trans isomerase A (cyclophilin A)
MIQGGDPQGTGMGGPGYQFEDETKGSPHKFDKPGKLAMANAGPNTNGSQFFMVYSDSGFPPSYTPFGRVTEGLDILSQVAKGGVTGPNDDQPKTKVVIKDVEIVPA